MIQVNPEDTPLDAVADANLRDRAARLLPALVDAVWGGAEPA